MNTPSYCYFFCVMKHSISNYHKLFIYLNINICKISQIVYTDLYCKQSSRVRHVNLFSKKLKKQFCFIYNKCPSVPPTLALLNLFQYLVRKYRKQTT